MLLLVAACSKPATTTSLPQGWIDELVRQPELFTGLLDSTGREGWIALHRGDLPVAVASFPSGPAGVRARLELAAVHADLARLSRAVWLDAYALWSRKSGIPAGSAMPVIAALAALDGGDAPTAAAWLERGGDFADPDVAAVAASLAGGLSAVTAGGALGACVRAHLEARATGSLGPLSTCGGSTPGASPLIREGERSLYDPMLHQTLALVYARQAELLLADPRAGLRDSGLPALVFSGWWSAADLADADPAGAIAAPPAWAPPLPSLADPDVVHPWNEQLDVALDAWELALRDQAGDEGENLLDELDLRAVYRGRLMLGLARTALAQGHARTAGMLALGASDLTQLNRFTPRNPPGLYAVHAEAWYRLGDARAALNTLSVLHEAWPELLGLRETMGDLAILQTLDRQGDSKEN